MSLPMTARLLAVVGSGSFARSICQSLASFVPSYAPIRVTVLARNGAAVEEIVRVCRIRTAISGACAIFGGEELRDEREMIGRLRPDVLVCCASTQSPYERIARPSPWTGLMERAGFGITLPFQASLVSRLATAIDAESPETLLINGCFPDAVNPLLAALELPVYCGIGNVATLAACLAATLGAANQGELRMLGHHAQLSPPQEPEDDVRAWLGGTPIPDVTALLAADRALPRRELNAIAGHAAARLLVDLVGGNEIRTNLPGPLGLPGGYPVRLAGRSVTLNLPDEVSRADAVEWNTRAGLADGVEISDGRVSYGQRAATELERHLPGIAAGWPVAALDEVGNALGALRHRLRQVQPIEV